jgi:hypothetical protein
MGRQVMLLKIGRLSGKCALTPIFYHKERALWALLSLSGTDLFGA